MLVMPLKPAIRCDVQVALSKWLDSDQEISYDVAMRMQSNPLEFVIPKPSFRSSACIEELKRIQSLRNCICDAYLKSRSHQNAMDENALQDSYEYHAVLLEFEKRGFPATHDDPGTGLSFTWKTAYPSPSSSLQDTITDRETHTTLVWERANVTYNIAALLSYRASMQSVNDREQCKVAVSSLQTAAGLLRILQELIQSMDIKCVELSIPMLQFWEHFFVAHAQYYIYRMARIPSTTTTQSPSSTNHGSLSKLAQSAHLLYNDAMVQAQDPRLGSDVPEEIVEDEWRTYCKAQSMMCAVHAEYHAAVVYRISMEWGHEITRMRMCLDKLNQLREFLKTTHTANGGVVQFIQKECKLIYPIISDRFHEADQDNYKIYQDSVPKTLPELENRSLVRIQNSLPESMLMPQKPLFIGL